jgi:hypothetical protein
MARRVITDTSLCDVCRTETRLVVEAFEALGGIAVPASPHTPVRELLSVRLSDPRLSRSVPDEDSLDQVERLMALELEYGPKSAEFTTALEEATTYHIFRGLLGPASRLSRWDPHTIWTRSLRGIVNERVKHRGGCSCGESESRAV